MHSQWDPMPGHCPTTVGQALGDPQPHETGFVSPRLSRPGTHQEAPGQGAEPLEGVLGGIGAQPSLDGDLRGAGTMSRCPPLGQRHRQDKEPAIPTHACDLSLQPGHTPRPGSSPQMAPTAPCYGTGHHGKGPATLSLLQPHQPLSSPALRGSTGLKLPHESHLIPGCGQGLCRSHPPL